MRKKIKLNFFTKISLSMFLLIAIIVGNNSIIRTQATGSGGNLGNSNPLGQLDSTISSAVCNINAGNDRIWAASEGKSPYSITPAFFGGIQDGATWVDTIYYYNNSNQHNIITNDGTNIKVPWKFWQQNYGGVNTYSNGLGLYSTRSDIPAGNFWEQPGGSFKLEEISYHRCSPFYNSTPRTILYTYTSSSGITGAIGTSTISTSELGSDSLIQSSKVSRSYGDKNKIYYLFLRRLTIPTPTSKPATNTATPSTSCTGASKTFSFAGASSLPTVGSIIEIPGGRGLVTNVSPELGANNVTVLMCESTTPTPNTAPTAPIVNGPNIVTLDTSYDMTLTTTDTDKVRYTIDWGDGNRDRTAPDLENGVYKYVPATDNTSAGHIYRISGKREVKVSATDQKGATSPATTKAIEVCAQGQIISNNSCVCESGYYLIPGRTQASCQPCLAGSYKATTGNQACTQCNGIVNTERTTCSTTTITPIIVSHDYFQVNHTYGVTFRATTTDIDRVPQDSPYNVMYNIDWGDGSTTILPLRDGYGTNPVPKSAKYTILSPEGTIEYSTIGEKIISVFTESYSGAISRIVSKKIIVYNCTSSQYYNISSKQCTECSTGYYGKSSQRGYAPGYGTTISQGCNRCNDGNSSTTLKTQQCQVTTPTPSPVVSSTTCQAGQEPSPSGTGCTKCLQGTYSSDGKRCVECPNGQTSFEGASRCSTLLDICPAPNTCQKGYERVNGTCNKCLQGTYSSNGLKCLPCDNGKTSFEGAAECTILPGTCKKCDGGQVLDSLGKCVCPAGTTWSNNSCIRVIVEPSCSALNANYNSFTGRCDECPTGKIRNSSTGICECPLGKIWNRLSCVDNPIESSPPSTPKVTTTTCDPGQEPSTDKGCNKCPEGYGSLGDKCIQIIKSLYASPGLVYSGDTSTLYYEIINNASTTEIIGEVSKCKIKDITTPDTAYDQSINKWKGSVDTSKITNPTKYELSCPNTTSRTTKVNTNSRGEV